MCRGPRQALDQRRYAKRPSKSFPLCNFISFVSKRKQREGDQTQQILPGAGKQADGGRVDRNKHTGPRRLQERSISL